MINSSRLTKLLNREHSIEKWRNSSMNGICKSLSKRVLIKLLNRQLKEMEKAANRITILLQML
nr:MAG TPA: hypothetical protein [Bacteriophage sp.]